VRTFVLGLGFDLLESPGEWLRGTSPEVRGLWITMFVPAAPLLALIAVGHYAGVSWCCGCSRYVRRPGRWSPVMSRRCG
jgi:hypothetical protein